MMATKIVVVVMTVAALGHGIAATEVCLDRQARRRASEITKEAKCGHPQQILVPMPVPEGYDYVYPSVEKVKQCSELPCETFSQKCLPRNTIPRNFTVDGYRGVNKDCLTVTVFEHDDCECGCSKLQCREDMVFKDTTCSCECDPSLKLACKTRRDLSMERVMWSEDTCSCVCDHKLDCGDPKTSVFDWDECRCVDKPR